MDTVTNFLKGSDAGKLGARLADVRRSRSISQEDVAKYMEVSRPTVVAMEKGTRPIKPNELELLAKLYGRTVHELLSSRESLTEFAPRFRLTQTNSDLKDKIDEAITLFQSLCEDYLYLEEVLNAPFSRTAAPELYAIDGLPVQSAAEEVATMERSRLNLGQGPLSNLIEILENDAGLRVFAFELTEFRIAGMFAYTDRLGGCIFVNGSHPRSRQNWSLAHEYGHYLTDRFRGEVSVLVEYERKPRSEQVADHFAASFLMPAGGLRQRFHRIVQSRGDFTVADLCTLADQYDVSVEAMARRLESLGSIPKGTWDRLSAKELKSSKVNSVLGIASRHGTRQRFPERYRRLAVQAADKAKITETELMRILHCSRIEAREICAELMEVTEVGISGQPYQLKLDFGKVLSLNETEKAGKE